MSASRHSHDYNGVEKRVFALYIAKGLSRFAPSADISLGFQIIDYANEDFTYVSTKSKEGGAFLPLFP